MVSKSVSGGGGSHGAGTAYSPTLSNLGFSLDPTFPSWAGLGNPSPLWVRMWVSTWLCTLGRELGLSELVYSLTDGR